MSTTGKIKTGSVLAAGAAALLLGGYALDSRPAWAGEAQVHCIGVNSCKGQSECKTAHNDCKGMNTCKGQGFLAMSAKECKAEGGTVESQSK